MQLKVVKQETNIMVLQHSSVGSRLGMSDTAILVSQSILKPLLTILNSSQYLQICHS